jgi:flagellar hook-associated protein FlgK
MSEINENILHENFINAEQFYRELRELENIMPSLLNDFRRDFVNFNLNPENNEYQQAFQNDKNMLNAINNDTEQLVKNIEKSTEYINESLFELNMLIQEAKQLNRQLKKELGIVNNEVSASDELISDYKEMYNYGYLRNWGLALCIIIAGMIITKAYPGRQVNMASN